MAESSCHHQYVYIVEHLDVELETWSALEYGAIAAECLASGAKFTLSSVPGCLDMQAAFQGNFRVHIEHDSVENLYEGRKGSVCLLDPAAPTDLTSDDGTKFNVFLFGGILGDDPPRDRTSELREKGFESRRLGPMQMTTDTAVRVTRLIIQESASLGSIQFIDNPEIRVSECEQVQMPFRYVRGSDGRPIMPDGMIDLIKNDSRRGLEGLIQ